MSSSETEKKVTQIMKTIKSEKKDPHHNRVVKVNPFTPHQLAHYAAIANNNKKK